MLRIKLLTMINQCLKLILDSSSFINIHIVGIAGSIGRKEKCISDKNLNDIDFFVLADSVVYKKKELLDNKLKQITNTEFTDITFVKTKYFLKQMRNSSISQFHFDLLHGNVIIYSNNSIDLSNFVNKHSILMESGVLVLLTRMWCLIGPFKFEKKKIICKNVDFALYQLQKAYSAIVDSVLIKEKSYMSPLTNIKHSLFNKTRFYKLHYDKIDSYNMYYKQKNHEMAYKSLLTLYLNTFEYYRINSINFLNFPIKNFILKSLYRNDIRLYMKTKIQEFQNLCKINLQN